MRMRVRPCTTAIVTLLGVLVGAQAQAQSPDDARLFENLAGTWSGTGVASASGGAGERVRCRADYNPSSPTRLRLSITCASDAFNLQIDSDVTRQGNRITGNWSESTMGVSGDLSGSAGADRIDAVADGTGFSARLSLAVHGNTQTVRLSSEGPSASAASVTLRRQ